MLEYCGSPQPQKLNLEKKIGQWKENLAILAGKNFFNTWPLLLNFSFIPLLLKTSFLFLTTIFSFTERNIVLHLVLSLCTFHQIRFWDLSIVCCHICTQDKVWKETSTKWCLLIGPLAQKEKYCIISTSNRCHYWKSEMNKFCDRKKNIA